MKRLKFDYGFPLMASILPETPRPDGDGWWIAHVEVTEDYARFSQMRTTVTGQSDMIEPGTYAMLRQRRRVNGLGRDDVFSEITWMSDLFVERDSNRAILRAARGDVLLVGLGIGMVAVAMCRKREVASVTVLEIEPDVIRLVAPHIAHRKLRVVQADAWRPPLRGRRFDVIYIDLWYDICVDYWEDYKRLCRMYRPLTRPGGLVTAWQKDHIQYLVQSGRLAVGPPERRKQ